MKCRKCGCTDDRACVKNGIPCHWVAENLCSACGKSPAKKIAKNLTWQKLARYVAKHGREDNAVVIQRVLRAFHIATGRINDPGCDILNAFHGLDPKGRTR